jgi:hypothetical protein
MFFMGDDIGPAGSSSFRDAPSGADPESIYPRPQAARWIPGSTLRVAPE